MHASPRQEIAKEIARELVGEIASELRQEIASELRQEIASELRQEIASKLADAIKQHVSAALTEALLTAVRAALRDHRQQAAATPHMTCVHVTLYASEAVCHCQVTVLRLQRYALGLQPYTQAVSTYYVSMCHGPP